MTLCSEDRVLFWQLFARVFVAGIGEKAVYYAVLVELKLIN